MYWELPVHSLLVPRCDITGTNPSQAAPHCTRALKAELKANPKKCLLYLDGSGWLWPGVWGELPTSRALLFGLFTLLCQCCKVADTHRDFHPCHPCIIHCSPLSPACAAWIAALHFQQQSSAAAEKVPMAERDFKSVFELRVHRSKYTALL